MISSLRLAQWIACCVFVLPILADDLQLTASPSSALFGAPVVLTAAVSAGDNSPADRVSFYCGTKLLGTRPVQQGQASLTTQSLPTGDQQIRAVAWTAASTALGTTTQASAATHIQVTSTPAQGFAPLPSSPPANLQAQMALVEDVNNDGLSDILTADQSGIRILVELNLDGGRFSAPIAYPLGKLLQSFVAADINGDGALDLVTLENQGVVRVLWGQGDGTFTAGPVITTAANAYGLVAADFNADGRTDLALNIGGNRLELWLGHGDGSFTMTGQTMSSSFSLLTVADLNNDGLPDLVIGHSALDVNGTATQVETLLGRGDGTFISRGTQSFGYVYAVMAADLNQDGLPDLIVAYNGFLSVSLGTGDGLFAPALQVNVGFALSSLQVGDVNSDGMPDVVAGANGGPSSFLVFLGDGTGALSRTSFVNNYFSLNNPVWLVDVNHDGRIDVLQPLGAYRVYAGIAPADLAITLQHSGAFRQGQPDAMYTISVNNTGTVDVTGLVSVFDQLPPGLTVVDIHGDGWQCSGALDQASCSRADGIAGNTTAAPIQLTVAVSPDAPPQEVNQVHVSLTGDNDAQPANNVATDTAVVYQTQQIIFGTLADRALGNSPVSLQAAVASGLPVQFAAAGSCAVSGGNQLVLIGTGPCQVTATQSGDDLHLAAAAVTRTFQVSASAATINLAIDSSPSLVGQPVPLQVTAQPTDAQGWVTFYDGEVTLGSVRLVNGTANFTAYPQRPGERNWRARLASEPPYAPSSDPAVVRHRVIASAAQSYDMAYGPSSAETAVLVTADANGDGHPDLLLNSSISTQSWLNDGSGHFPTVIRSAAQNSPTRYAAAGDFNGDGILDVVSIGQRSFNGPSFLTVRLGQGDGTFTVGMTLTTAAGRLAVGDFNGDGIDDVAVAHGSSVSVFLGTRTGQWLVVNDPYAAPIDVPVEIVATDVNHDGQIDLVTLTLDGLVTTRLGQGDGTFLLAPSSPVQLPLNLQTAATGLAAGDFNQDGFRDLAIGAIPASPSDNRCGVTTLPGNGDGTWGVPTFQSCSDVISGPYSNPLPDQPTALLVTDLNGDGQDDIAAVFARNGLQVFSGHGDGTFGSSAAAYPLSGNFPPTVVQAAELNGDGRLDLLLTDTESRVVNVWSGRPSASLSIAQTAPDTVRFRELAATFSLVVTNAPNAGAATQGEVVASDVTSNNAGLAGMAGDGWTCANLNCRRSDPLPPGASYPPLIVTVQMNAGGDPTLVNRAIVTGGGSAATESRHTQPILPAN